jgi:HSP20 family protein
MSEQLTNDTKCCADTCEKPLVKLRPAYRTTNTENGVTLDVVVPGATKEGLELSSRENILSIRAPRDNSVPADWKVRQADPKPDVYELQVRLHGSLDPASASAELADGILRLQITKREEALPRRITVN